MSTLLPRTVARHAVGALLACLAWGLVSCGGEPEPSVSKPTSSASTETAPRAELRALPDTSPDRFLPAGSPAATPRRGGTVVVHVEALPRHLNYLTDNSGVTRRILQELHGTLLARDLFTGEHCPQLAESWVVEDTLVRLDGRRLYGELVSEAEGWRVVPRSTPGHALASSISVASADIGRVERGTVFTFRLREGLRWHDGRPLRPEDFLLTWRLSKIPQVQCDEKRFEFDHLVHAEKLDERTLRFFYDRQYFGAAAVFESLVPLPAHVYDLRDPLHPAPRPEASDEELARHVNEHAANRRWVGIGPYRLVEFNDEYVEAVRAENGWPAEDSGWFDSIRWRVITDDALAYRAMCAGEIDFTSRLLSDDYFRSAEDASFRARAYTGYFYTPRASYVAWNLKRPQFADVRVRTALALACDFEGYIDGFYRGLAQRVTAEWFDGGRDYDRELAPLPFDVARARALLTEAGWYDRDGDGFADRDGEALRIEILTQAGSRSGEVFLQRYQETLAQAGVKLEPRYVAWPKLLESVREREFDGVFKVWVVPIESDPHQRWHSDQVGRGTANETSFADAKLDRAIESYAEELDPERRGAISREIHRRLYAEQAYLYGVKVPHKFGASLRLRNVRVGPIDPGYRIRDWYFAE
jgi:ABC-type transport system substrate-binding protein